MNKYTYLADSIKSLWHQAGMLNLYITRIILPGKARNKKIIEWRLNKIQFWLEEVQREIKRLDI